MSKRTSIYLSPPLDELLLAHLVRDDSAKRSASSMLAAAVDRYLELVRRNLPEWSAAEWQLACDALNGCWLQEGAARAQVMVQMEIADAVEMNGAADKWDVDWVDFRPRLAALTHAQGVAVIEVAERFWADLRIGAQKIDALVQSVRSRQPLWQDEGADIGKSMAKRGEPLPRLTP